MAFVDLIMHRSGYGEIASLAYGNTARSTDTPYFILYRRTDCASECFVSAGYCTAPFPASGAKGAACFCQESGIPMRKEAGV